MSNRDFSRMFNPRGIAIVGANPDLSRPGRQTVLALERHGYSGGVYPVNPKYEEIGGKRCYHSIEEIDGDVDVAVVAIAAQHVAEVITQCGKKGIGFVVVVGGGFREIGEEGAKHERRMLEAAKVSGVRIVGPNCLGFKNIHDKVFASFGSITRPPDLRPGPVSALIQSGGYGNSMIIQCHHAGIGFRYLVASGSESDIRATELIEAYVDDNHTKVILAYLEGVHDGRAFMAAARRALAAGKPLVVVKAGNTCQGQRAAASHTAFLAGSYDVYQAAFKQCGVIEAQDIGDAVDILQSLVSGRTAQGRNVAVMSGSGGSLVSFSDAADDHKLTLGALHETTRAILSRNIPNIGSVVNPIDLTAGYQKKENVARYKECIEAVLADPGIDQLGLFLATAAGEDLSRAASAVVNAVNPSSKPIYIFSSLPYELTVAGREIFRAAGVPFLGTPRRVAAAMAKVADYGQVRARNYGENVSRSFGEQSLIKIPPNAMTLDEFASKKILSDIGIPVTRDVLLDTSEEYVFPESLNFPVVVKVISPDIPHKSDIGGVQIGIRDHAEFSSACKRVVSNAHTAVPAAQIVGVLVSEMITDGLETIIGVLNDLVFGPVVVFGLGGVFAEILRDTTCRVAPFGLETAREMIGDLRASRIFAGVRGQRPFDSEALAKVLVNVSEFAWVMRDRLVEMDINPVFVRTENMGVNAADALIVLKDNAQFTRGKDATS